MSLTNETTAHLGLTLPHPTNALEDDVLRLRSALNAIDAKFAQVDATLASNDPSLDTLQEVVNVLKSVAADLGTVTEDLVDHIGAGGNVHAAATGTVAGFMPAADKAKLDGVSLGAMIDPVVITATNVGQTSFTVPGGYTPGAIDVLLDGVELMDDDYTATDGTTVELTVGVEVATAKLKVKRYRQCLRA